MKYLQAIKTKDGWQVKITNTKECKTKAEVLRLCRALKLRVDENTDKRIYAED